jgi:hypothetical protein
MTSAFTLALPTARGWKLCAPGAVATGFQILPHQCLYLIRTQPVFATYFLKGTRGLVCGHPFGLGCIWRRPALANLFHQNRTVSWLISIGVVAEL